MNSGVKRTSPYKVITLIILVILAILFAFPLYWIVTGAFKTAASINATTPDWFPKEWVMDNFNKLLAARARLYGSLPYLLEVNSRQMGIQSFFRQVL